MIQSSLQCFFLFMFILLQFRLSLSYISMFFLCISHKVKNANKYINGSSINDVTPEGEGGGYKKDDLG